MPSATEKQTGKSLDQKLFENYLKLKKAGQHADAAISLRLITSRMRHAAKIGAMRQAAPAAKDTRESFLAREAARLKKNIPDASAAFKKRMLDSLGKSWGKRHAKTTGRFRANRVGKHIVVRHSIEDSDQGVNKRWLRKAKK